MDAVTVFAQTLNLLIYGCGKIRGNYCNITDITSTLINQVIPLLSFQGLTGPIAYNQTKPDRRRTSTIDCPLTFRIVPGHFPVQRKHAHAPSRLLERHRPVPESTPAAVQDVSRHPHLL